MALALLKYIFLLILLKTNKRYLIKIKNPEKFPPINHHSKFCSLKAIKHATKIDKRIERDKGLYIKNNFELLCHELPTEKTRNIDDKKAIGAIIVL